EGDLTSKTSTEHQSYPFKTKDGLEEYPYTWSMIKLRTMYDLIKHQLETMKDSAEKARLQKDAQADLPELSQNEQCDSDPDDIMINDNVDTLKDDWAKRSYKSHKTSEFNW
uniref:Uncharacterized protein n=1 Tax=Romanomermis culicivorax TaxID=13658 RepID=A0A915KKH3_ROMCU